MSDEFVSIASVCACMRLCLMAREIIIIIIIFCVVGIYRRGK